MKLNIVYVFLFMCLSFGALFAQETNGGKQIVYFDKEYNMVDKSNGAYYIEINKANGKIVNPCTEYYMNGTTHWTGNVLTCEQGNYVTDGLCTWYDEQGKKQCQVIIIANKFEGKFTAWWANGKIKEETTYVDGLVDGCDKTYDEGGKCIASIIFVKGKTDYTTIPDDPKYKVECNCPGNTQISTNTNVSSNNYSTDQIGYYFNDILAYKESYLFKTITKKNTTALVYFYYNSQETSVENQEVADAVLDGLIKSEKFTRISFDKYNDYKNEKLTYFISYSDIIVNTTDVPKDDGSIHYSASIDCYINIKDVSGRNVESKKMSGKTFNEILGVGITPATQKGARDMCNYYIRKHTSKYFEKNFKFD